MEPIVYIRKYDELTEKQKYEMHTLRYDVFVRRLRWSLNTENQLDIDEYDRPDAKFIVIEYQNKVVACWRLIHADTPYMLKHTFPELLQGESFDDHNVIELSRFAVDREVSKQASHINFTELLFYLVVQYGFEQGFTTFITPTTTGIERIMRHVGIPNQRIGDGKIRMLEHTKSVALRVPINEALRNWFTNASINQHRLDRAG
ncbi:acyl-homoserine-lactone synthase [Vibrio mediterranei]|uniref:acyl-homoserine-lactone synthase n=1 Tax=Vibrio mediterranei TaxID=689 RepID=UPI00068200A2|nr:acyl-homoserine-lactone synthase [Vibrio mediterranei]